MERAHPDTPPAARSAVRSGLRRLALLAAALLLLAWSHASAQGQGVSTFEILIDGSAVATTFGEGGTAELASGERLEVAFEGGSAAILIGDVGVWDFAHVLAVTIRRLGDGSFRFDTTVRHRDEGWDHYADLWRVVGDGVENGERVLLHPHDNEQPFTRSQSGVRAAGVVTVEARDSVDGWGGSVIRIDLDSLTAEQVTVELRVGDER